MKLARRNFLNVAASAVTLSALPRYGRSIIRRGRLAAIPEGCRPRRLSVELAAGYVGEKTVAAFVSRVRRGEYPSP
jgi:hypothetical protein